MILARFPKRRFWKRILRIWLPLYLLMPALFCFSLPDMTYREAAAQVRQTEGIGDAAETVPGRFYSKGFVDTAHSDLLPSGYYTVVFENRRDILFYIDPYTGAYASGIASAPAHPAPGRGEPKSIQPAA